MSGRRSGWRRLDLVQPAAAAALAALGLATLGAVSPAGLARQLPFLALGLAAYAAASACDLRRLAGAWPWLYAAGVAALLAVHLGGHVRLGAQRWLSLAGIPVEPSEPAKLLMVLALSGWLARRDRPGLRESLLAAALGAPPLALLLLQPDLGTALVIGALVPGLIFLGGASRRTVAALAVAAAPVLALAPRLLHGYQRTRLDVFWDPGRDPLGAGYNVLQARLVIASGGVVGRAWTPPDGTAAGWWAAARWSPGLVPDGTTDFIFSLFAQLFGLVGCLLLLGLFGVLVWRLARASAVAPDRFSRLVCAGLALLVAVQVAENVGMNVGLAPVAGIPLPLLSSGGSALVTTLAGLGLAQSAVLRRPAVVLHETEPDPLLYNLRSCPAPVDPPRPWSSAAASSTGSRPATASWSTASPPSRARS